jgi:hypothetical protein
MTGFELDGPRARFLYYLLNGDADRGHDDHYDDAKAVEAKLPLPRLRVCVLKTVHRRHQITRRRGLPHGGFFVF